MMLRPATLLALVTLLAAPALTGCDKLVEQVTGKTKDSSDDSSAKKSDEADEDETPKKKQAPPPNPNDAFFTTGTKSHALFRVRDGKVDKLKTEGCKNVDALFMDPEGNAWLQCFEGIFRSEGEEIVAVDAPVKRPKLVKGRDGSLWIFTGKPASLHKREADAWKKVEVPEGLDLTWNLEVDKKGRPWAATKGAVWLRQGETWQPAPLDKHMPESKYAPKLTATDDGMMFVLTDKMKYVGIEADDTVGKRTYPNYKRPMARPGGGVIIEDSAWGRTIQLIDAKGKSEKTLSPKGKVYYDGQNYNSEHIAGDTQGRLWVGSRYGLIVVLADGTMNQWEPGRVEGVTGVSVENVAVGGTGPKLPDLKDKVRATVKGKIDTDKSVKVEFCAGGIGFSDGTTRSFYGATPCANKPIGISTKTDKDGNFELKNVPPYPMSLLVQASARSWADRDPKCCVDLKAGETRDIGTHKK